MKRCALAMLAAFACVHARAADFPPSADAHRIRAATVLVNVVYGEGQYAEITSGSGILVAPGIVLTNAHIVNEKVPTRISVQNEYLPPAPAAVAALRYDGNEFTADAAARHIASALVARAGLADIHLSRPQTNFDMAILTFMPPPGAPPPLAFALQAVPGESVVAAGYPDSNGGRPAAALSPGFVTRLINRAPGIVVHSAPCSHGNSGGPLVNARGEVVGMQTWTSVRSEADGVMSMAAGSGDLVAFLHANGVAPLVTGTPVPRPAPEEPRDAQARVLGFADAGDANYQALAGLLYRLGDCGFPQDDSRAVHYLELALRTAPNGPSAYLYQAGLAVTLFQSRQFHQPEYAESLLRAANNSTVVDAHSSHPDLKLLAYESSLYLQGRAAGVRHDPERSLRLAEKAMAGGFALPYALLGYHAYFGDSPAGRDHAKALRFAREAARNGIPEGISLLALCYYHSDVVEADGEHFAIARRLAEEAAYMGDAWALGLLANMLYDSPDPAERARAYGMAMLGLPFGNRLALFCLGRIAWDGYLANPADFASAARALGYIEQAEKLGVRLGERHGAGAPVTSGGILAHFPHGERQRLVDAARRE